MPVALQIFLWIAACIAAIPIEFQFQTHGINVPLRLIMMLGASSWAAWDAHRLKIWRYKTAMALPPWAIFLLCFMMALIFVSLYLYGRDKVVRGTAAENPESDARSQMKALRLLLFAIVSIVVGAVGLFCAFAPNINPAFVTDSLFRPDFFTSLDAQREAFILQLSPQREREELKKILAALKDPTTNFSEYALNKPDEVSFQTTDGETLKGWWFKTDNATDTVLFNCSGWGDKRLPLFLGYIKLLQEAKMSVLVYDYRGYGLSTGKSTLTSAYRDAEAAFAFLTSKELIPEDHIIVMGRDVGAYASCKLAEQHKVKALILEEPWTTLKAFVDDIAPTMQVVPLSSYPDKGLDNMSYLLKPEHAPVLVVGTSSEDPSAYELFQHMSGKKAFVHLNEFEALVMPNLADASEQYKSTILKFLANPSAYKSAPSIASGDNSTAGPVIWQKDLESAKAAAKAANKAVFIDVYTTWCPPCKVLDRDMQSNAELQAFLNKHCVCVKADSEDQGAGTKIADEYEVHKYPTIILLDPQGFFPIGRMHGYRGPVKFITLLKSLGIG